MLFLHVTVLPATALFTCVCRNKNLVWFITLLIFVYKASVFFVLCDMSYFHTFIIQLSLNQRITTYYLLQHSSSLLPLTSSLILVFVSPSHLSKFTSHRSPLTQYRMMDRRGKSGAQHGHGAKRVTKQLNVAWIRRKPAKLTRPEGTRPKTAIMVMN